MERALHATGRRVVATREPGGTPIGEQIRAVLHAHENVALVPAAEILLYAADRAQHVREVVVRRCSAATSSSPIATPSPPCLPRVWARARYGGAAAHHGIRHRRASARPGDLSRLDVELGLQRKRRAQALDAASGTAWTSKRLPFISKMRTGYLTMAAETPSWLVIDATRSIEAVHRVIYERIETML